MVRRRAGPEEDDLVLGKELADSAADTLALVDLEAQALMDRCFECEWTRCAAIGAVDETLVVELHQVSPDRLMRDPQCRRELRCPDRGRRIQFRDDPLMTLGF